VLCTCKTFCKRVRGIGYICQTFCKAKIERERDCNARIEYISNLFT
jgi:hypothetical protein